MPISRTHSSMPISRIHAVLQKVILCGRGACTCPHDKGVICVSLRAGVGETCICEHYTGCAHVSARGRAVRAYRKVWRPLIKSLFSLQVFVTCQFYLPVHCELTFFTQLDKFSVWNTFESLLHLILPQQRIQPKLRTEQHPNTRGQHVAKVRGNTTRVSVRDFGGLSSFSAAQC